MQIVKRIFTVKKCILGFAILIAFFIMLSGQKAQAAEMEETTFSSIPILKTSEKGVGLVHAFKWGTLIPASGTAVTVKGKDLMRSGESQQLTAECSNYNGDFIYTSSNPSVVRIDTNGYITAVSGGKATITAQTETIPGSNVICRGTLEITVFNSNYVYLSSINIGLMGTNMSVGVKQKVTLTTYPNNAYIEPGFQYESSDGRVLLIDDTGVLTAVGEGVATITVTSKDGQNIRATATITVANTTGISITGITLNGDKTMVIGDKQVLAATVTPLNASVTTLRYVSSSESVATVSQDGTVTALGVGTTEISVYSQDGSNVSTSFSLSVTGRQATKLTVKGTNTMEVGDTQTLNVTIEPTNTTNRTLRYTSSNINVATVSDRGFISANAVGTAIITVETMDGSNLRESITITVTEKQIKVTSIALNVPGGTELAIDEYRQITAVAFPLNATNPDLDWNSSNEDVASVDGNGIVTAYEAGKAIIIASATDGTGITGRVMITVYEPSGTPKSISLDGETKMVVDTEQELAVVVNPERTVLPELEWSSSNEDILNVSDGVVSADGVGKAIITAIDEKGLLKASITITVVNEEVEEPEEGDDIWFENVDGTLELKEGESFTVYSNYQVDSSVQYLTWRTSNSVVASVNQKGKITARSSGKATITVATMDGEYTEKIKVKVVKKEYKITFDNLTSKNKMQLKSGGSKKVRYSLQADGTKAASYTWTTSKQSIVQVSEKGKLTGIKKGKSKITLKLKLENGKIVKKSFWAVVKK